MTRAEQQKAVENAIATFPHTFGLAAYPGIVFRISPNKSYRGR